MTNDAACKIDEGARGGKHAVIGVHEGRVIGVRVHERVVSKQIDRARLPDDAVRRHTCQDKRPRRIAPAIEIVRRIE